jgi:hypothetical protein
MNAHHPTCPQPENQLILLRIEPWMVARDLFVDSQIKDKH